MERSDGMQAAVSGYKILSGRLHTISAENSMCRVKILPNFLLSGGEKHKNFGGMEAEDNGIWRMFFCGRNPAEIARKPVFLAARMWGGYMVGG